MRLPRLPFAILLGLLLIFAQQAAVTHALSHHSKQQQQDKHFPGAKACEKCAAFAELSAAVASTASVFHIAAFTPRVPCAAVGGVTQAAFSLYHSRAPPSPA